MARIPWRFEDLVEGTVALMPINPNEGASPNYQKSLTKATTTAPGAEARPIIFEGSDQIIQFDFSGALLTQAHYDFVYDAWAKRHPVRLTDDLGRQFTIYFETFSPKRDLSRTYPWKHTYQATTVIVDHA
jgi:hypothetical protein